MEFLESRFLLQPRHINLNLCSVTPAVFTIDCKRCAALKKLLASHGLALLIVHSRYRGLLVQSEGYIHGYLHLKLGLSICDFSLSNNALVLFSTSL